MTARTLPCVFALSGSLAIAACGNDKATVAATEQSSPEQAIAEIGKVRTALDGAVAAVKGGDKARADEILSEGYVAHFENVEHPLEEVDAQLKESLEETLSTKIRDKVKAGAPADEVKALVDGAKADLDTAESKLK
jgi:hypothetical protein